MRNVSLSACFALVVLAVAPAAAEPSLLWRLGRPDRDYREFAIAGNHSAFSRVFRHGVVVNLAAASSEASWPFIHPGPMDAWAGSRQHTFRVRFVLNEVPGPTARLTIGLVDTHDVVPPTLMVRVNGRLLYQQELPAGGPDASLQDARHGKPLALVLPFSSAALRRGGNTLDLTVISGSWLLYDHLTLEGGLSAPTGPIPSGIRAGSTMLFRRVRGQLRQVVEVYLNNDGIEGDVTASVTGDPLSKTRLKLMPGPNRLEITTLPVRAARDAEVVLRAGNATAHAHVQLRPERRWTVYVAPSSHTDIGYTDLQEKAIAVHLNNTVTALRALRQMPDFTWNLEVAYHADIVREHRPDQISALRRAIASGRIGVQGLYLNMLTGLCSSEEMVRVLSPAARLRQLGPRVATAASLNDVPSAVGTIPTLLSHAGYRYFTDAVNEYRGPVFRHADPRLRQSPFWWEGPDGSRVLAILTHGYAQASGIGLTSSSADVARRLPGWLRGFDRSDYPGAAVLAYGGVSDNVAMTPAFAKVAREWNRQYAHPRIVVGQVSDFFEHVERETAGRLPVFKGDFGTYWEDGAGSSAYETALTRHARAQLSAAQRLLALASGSSYPRAAIDEAWNNVVFYNEHTWGAWCSVSAPDSEQTREQWIRKAAFAHKAYVATQEVVGALGERRPTVVPGIVRVWNPLAWTRDIIVTVPLKSIPNSRAVAVRALDGAFMPAQVETHGGCRVAFLARAVAGLSYAEFRIEPGGSDGEGLMRPGSSPTEWVTSNYRIELDPETGAVRSLIDLATGREWVGATGGRGLNQFLYVRGGEGSSLINQNGPAASLDIRTHTRSEARLVENGPVRSVLFVTRRGNDVPAVDTWIIVDATGRLHLRNVVHKSATLAKEAGYFAFPSTVNPTNGRGFVDVPMGYVEAERAQLAGACREWYTCTTHAAVSDDEASMVVAMPHSPLATFGDIFRGRWLDRLDIAGTVYAYVFNNYWDTNYCARQSGDLTFAFTLDLTLGPYDAARAARFGQEAALAAPDPQAVRIGGSVLDGSELAFSGPANDAAMFGLTVREAEVFSLERDKDTIVVGLLNLKAQPVEAVVSVEAGKIVRAQQTNLVGERAAPIPAADNRSVTVAVPAYAPAMLRLTLGASRPKPHRGAPIPR